MSGLACPYDAPRDERVSRSDPAMSWPASLPPAWRDELARPLGFNQPGSGAGVLPDPSLGTPIVPLWQRGGRLRQVKIIVLLAIVGIVLLAWLTLRGYRDGGPDG